MPHKDPIAGKEYKKEYRRTHKTEKAAYDHARIEQQREKKAAYDKEYSKKNREKKNAYALQWHREHPAQVRNTWLTRTFKMTTAEWDAKFAAQNYRCAVCSTSQPGNRGWQTDHDHDCCPGVKSCGKCVRSILCWSCNTGLGHFKDSPALLSKAADYIDFWKRGVCT